VVRPIATSTRSVRRFGRLARAFGVRPEQAEELVDVVFEERAHSLAHIRAQVAAGHPSWSEFWTKIF
jgi:hypothetical protein